MTTIDNAIVGECPDANWAKISVTKTDILSADRRIINSYRCSHEDVCSKSNCCIFSSDRSTEVEYTPMIVQK